MHSCESIDGFAINKISSLVEMIRWQGVRRFQFYQSYTFDKVMEISHQNLYPLTVGCHN